jgi:hypothetical protein
MERKIEPLRTEKGIFSEPVKTQLEILAEMTHKRVGGGRVQMNVMSWEAIAKTIIPLPSQGKPGFDQQSNTEWTRPEFALSRIFREYGWPEFERAVVFAVVRRHSVVPKINLIPLAPGLLDIEAGMKIEAIYGHREVDVYGFPGEPDPVFKEKIYGIIGLATEYGNGPDSLEVVIPVYTPGTWTRIEDFELGRKTGIAMVTSLISLWCEGMSISSLTEMAWPVVSDKVREAVKIAKHLNRLCAIK